MTAKSKILAKNEVKILATMLAPFEYIVWISTKKVSPQRKYVLCGIELEQARLNWCFRSGVLLNEDLKCSKHITSISGKAID